MTKPVHIHAATLLIALPALWLPAQGQSVYRCGASYSDVPCPGAALVASEDARSAAQRAQADAATRRDVRLAGAQEAARLQREARPVPPLVLARASATQNVAAPAAAAGKHKKPELFTAIAPKKPGETTLPARKKKSAAA